MNTFGVFTMLLWGLSMAFALTTLFLKGGAELYFNVTFYLIPLLVGLIVGQYRAIRQLLSNVQHDDSN